MQAERGRAVFAVANMLKGSPRRPFGPVASAVVAATLASKLGTK
jgi:hypothetical protein